MSTVATLDKLYRQRVEEEIARRKDMLVTGTNDRLAGTIQGLEHAMTMFDDITDRLINDKPPAQERPRGR